jgi:hypothetical protein
MIPVTPFLVPWRRVDRRYDGPVVIQGTHIKLRRIRDIPRFMLVSIQVHRAASKANGAVGVALFAAPWRMRFLSVSAWRSEADVLAFMHSPAHARAMRLFRDSGREPGRFPRWTAHTDDGRPRWSEVFRRVDAAQPHRHADTDGPAAAGASAA